MVEFEVDMAYLLEDGELDRVVLHDENGEYPSMQFEPSRGTCKVRHSIVDEVGGGELDRWVCGECGHVWWSIEGVPSCCPNCGREVVE